MASSGGSGKRRSLLEGKVRELEKQTKAGCCWMGKEEERVEGKERIG